jgi:hypothetical protein
VLQVICSDVFVVIACLLYNFIHGSCGLTMCVVFYALDYLEGMYVYSNVFVVIACLLYNFIYGTCGLTMCVVL